MTAVRHPATLFSQVDWAIIDMIQIGVAMQQINFFTLMEIIIMCVNTQFASWERPAIEADLETIRSFFPGVDYLGLLEVMSRDGARPLTTDLVLHGAMSNTAPDELGMRYVPFTCLNKRTGEMTKLPVMDQISEWFENTALGTDMWNHVSDWSEQHAGTRVHFAMNCGCGLVATTGYRDGSWRLWKERFNASRCNLYGRTRVVRRDDNDLTDLDMTDQQLGMWLRIKGCLDQLAYRETDIQQRDAA